MRLFIAIRFDDKALDALEAARDNLFAQAVSGSLVPRENLHVTLVFLGSVAEEDVPSVEDALDEVEDSLDLRLSIDRIEPFGSSARKPASGGSEEATWVARFADNPALVRLQAHIEDSMRKLGIELEERDYVPHVTLGRRVVLEDGADAGHVARAALPEPIEIRTDSFSLMETRFQKGKQPGPPIYEEICCWE